MIRRFAIAVVAVAALSSCSSVDRGDAVASVGDHEMTEGQLESLLQSSVAGGPLAGTTADGNFARNVITVWVQVEALEQAGMFDGLDRDGAQAEAEAQFGEAFTTADEFTQHLLVGNALLTQLGNSGVLTREEALALIDEADVQVGSRYGRWNPADANVLPLGG